MIPLTPREILEAEPALCEDEITDEVEQTETQEGSYFDSGFASKHLSGHDMRV